MANRYDVISVSTKSIGIDRDMPLHLLLLCDYAPAPAPAPAPGQVAAWGVVGGMVMSAPAPGQVAGNLNRSRSSGAQHARSPCRGGVVVSRHGHGHGHGYGRSRSVVVISPDVMAVAVAWHLQMKQRNPSLHPCLNPSLHPCLLIGHWGMAISLQVRAMPRVCAAMWGVCRRVHSSMKGGGGRGHGDGTRCTRPGIWQLLLHSSCFIALAS